jgi:hypothetical protein
MSSQDCFLNRYLFINGGFGKLLRKEILPGVAIPPIDWDDKVILSPGLDSDSPGEKAITIKLITSLIENELKRLIRFNDLSTTETFIERIDHAFIEKNGRQVWSNNVSYIAAENKLTVETPRYIPGTGHLLVFYNGLLTWHGVNGTYQEVALPEDDVRQTVIILNQEPKLFDEIVCVVFNTERENSEEDVVPEDPEEPPEPPEPPLPPDTPDEPWHDWGTITPDPDYDGGAMVQIDFKTGKIKIIYDDMGTKGGGGGGARFSVGGGGKPDPEMTPGKASYPPVQPTMTLIWALDCTEQVAVWVIPNPDFESEGFVWTADMAALPPEEGGSANPSAPTMNFKIDGGQAQWSDYQAYNSECYSGWGYKFNPGSGGPNPMVEKAVYPGTVAGQTRPCPPLTALKAREWPRVGYDEVTGHSGDEYAWVQLLMESGRKWEPREDCPDPELELDVSSPSGGTYEVSRAGNHVKYTQDGFNFTFRVEKASDTFTVSYRKNC